MKRLTWLVGPPGAGKSTWVNSLREHRRVVELNEMLAPLVRPINLRKGILKANGALVAMLRDLERHPDNLGLPPLLIVGGLIAEEVLFPLADDEEVLLLLPPRERWEEQLMKRPVGRHGYDDYAYAKAWYDRFASWAARGLPVTRLEIPYDASLIGRVAEGD